MIMLGGLEENQTNNSGSGLPFLSRIPILRWFFGSRTKTKSKSKLTIFIKPTVIYS
jgi:type II secretory pathway component GspD/PulD (secretin)